MAICIITEVINFNLLLFSKTVILNLFSLAAPLVSCSKILLVPLVAKIGLKTIKSNNRGHPWHYLTAPRLRTTALEEHEIGFINLDCDNLCKSLKFT